VMQGAEEEHAVRRAGGDGQALGPSFDEGDVGSWFGLAVRRRLDRVGLDADHPRAERRELARGPARAAADVDDGQPCDRGQRGDRGDVGAFAEMLAFSHCAQSCILSRPMKRYVPLVSPAAECAHPARARSASRKSFLEILPTAVFGSSARISSALIISCLPSRSLRKSFRSSSVSGGAPALSLTKALGVSP